MPTEEYWISTTEKVEYMEQTVNRIADELTVIFVDVIGSLLIVGSDSVGFKCDDTVEALFSDSSVHSLTLQTISLF